MNKFKKALISAVSKTLKADKMLELSSFENKNKELAFSIFGFEFVSQAQLTQDAKDVLINARSAGLSASYLPPNALTGKSGSIYVGPKSSAKATTAEDAVSKVFG